VKITRAEPIKKAKSLPLDQFIASLCADDPRLDAAISEGSRWVAQSFYAEAPASIRKRRLETGMTQTQLAIAMDTSQSYIAKLERGEINAGMDVIGRLAKALSMKPEDAFILLFAEYEKKHD
jgi:DNA-binding XRE family transcriptional regulator